MIYNLFYTNVSLFINLKYSVALQTLRVYSALKRRGNTRFQVNSTRNTRGVFVGSFSKMKLFVKIINGWKLLERLNISDIRQSSEYCSVSFPAMCSGCRLTKKKLELNPYYREREGCDHFHKVKKVESLLQN